MTTLLSRRTHSTVVDRILSRICPWNLILSHRADMPFPHHSKEMKRLGTTTARGDSRDLDTGPYPIRDGDPAVNVLREKTGDARSRRDRGKRELHDPQPEQSRGFPPHELHVH